MSYDSERVQKLFVQAVALPNDQRETLLSEACGEDTELRQRVEALLRAHDAPDSLLDVGPEQANSGVTGAARGNAASAGFAFVQSDLEPGSVIAGRYELVEVIGSGGMGEVWVAKQVDSMKRKVALKVIKAGMDSKEILTRFEYERQALAIMNHPNIARVFDAGLTDRGQPFFVMELVNGAPLTKFCDEAKLSLPKRLQLFVAICHAVQHAHHKGVVHRDLKPANILVTLFDGEPVPKIIDFGVAKALGGKLTADSLSTRFGSIVGTLEYMAPEQAAFSGTDVDTRADIYSLGVILYELLTGLRPIDAAQLSDKAVDEMLRVIREDEPSKPSTRLSTNESLPTCAAVRNIEPHSLIRLLRGELDWIVMKCLEKARGRRYDTANELARDIQRYLAGDTVDARPPSAAYRISKFVRRNKGATIAASLVILTFVAGLIGTSLGWAKASREEKSALAEAAAKQKAWLQADDERRIALDAIVQALAIATPEFVPAQIEAMTPLSDSLLERVTARAGDETRPLGERINMACALSAWGHEVDASILAESILAAAPAMLKNISTACSLQKNAATVRSVIASQLDKEISVADRLRVAVVLLDLGDCSGINSVCAITPSQESRSTFIELFPDACLNWSTVAQHLVVGDISNEALSAICASIGHISRDSFEQEVASDVVAALRRTYTHAADAGAHSAAGWALRQWGEPLPVLTAQRESADLDWFALGDGTTILRVPSGNFPPGTPLIAGFFMADQEVSVRQFDAFINDADYPATEKPEAWETWRASTTEVDRAGGLWGPDKRRSPDLDCPIQGISLIDAILYCNWLSLRTGRTPCYRRASEEMTLDDSQVPGWLCDFDANGFRLPTYWEWRNAAAARAFPFHFGERLDLSSKYDWTAANSDSHTHPCASLSPNAWGFFDVHGNVSERLWTKSPRLPGFAVGGGHRTMDPTKCGFDSTLSILPVARSDDTGFRIACNDPFSSAAYQELLSALKTEVTAERPTQRAIRAWATTHDEFGNRHSANGDWVRALEAYSQALAALEEFVNANRDVLIANTNLNPEEYPARTTYLAVNQNFGPLYLKRSAILSRLGRISEALGDRVKAAEHAREVTDSDLQDITILACAAARNGDDAASSRAILFVETQQSEHPTILYNAACAMAICAGVVDDRTIRDQFSNRSIALLTAALLHGFSDANLLQSDADLDAIRALPRFQELLQSIDK